LLSLAALGFVILIYSNSFTCAWHYDDMGNILENENIRLESFSREGIKQALYTSTADGHLSIQRPLAFLSFALNYSVGGCNVWGFHLVNLMVHLITGVVLFRFIVTLLRTPQLNARYGVDALSIAFVGTVLWATHPIQVTAVTYIVQRMASMAAMFSIISLYAFLKGRLASRPISKYGYYLISLLAFFAGLATKENVIVLPFCMLLMNIIIVRGVDHGLVKRWIKPFLVILILAGTLGYLVVSIGNMTIPDSYPNRPYTPIQRLLTEPRVLVSYLAWIAVPLGSKLTLLHDIAYSRTIFDPLTTLPALLCVVGGTVTLAVLIRRYPLTAFCGLFFIINHSVEASFLNLGLVYEHRNYLPSMLLFVPPSAWFIRFLKRKELFSGLRIGCLAALVVLIFSNGHTVYNYNKVFRSELTLWFDVSLKSQGLSVAHNNLGKVLWDAGVFEKANEEFSLAMKLNRWIDFIEKGMVHHNMGLYQTYVAQDYQAALEHFQQAVEIMNGNPVTWYHLGRAYLMLGQLDAAEKNLSKAISHWPKESSLIVLMSVTQMQAGKNELALKWAEQAQRADPKNERLSILKAEIYRRSGHQDQAEPLFQAYLDSNPHNTRKASAMFSTEKKHYRNDSVDCRLLLELTGIDANPRNRHDTINRNYPIFEHAD
jgi:tetratricopeptide (TPR) repeat protein